MREIKFRYRLKQLDPKKGYEEWFEFYTIEQIERGEVQTTAEIIGRDQYTGLKDKNGKEIYEGNILQNCIDKKLFNWLVVFKNGCFVIRNIGVEGYLMDFFACDSEYYFIERQIIGNIYENPELMVG